MPLWVMVELLSFSNTVKLYNAMWISEKKAIAENMNTGPDTLKNNLCCLAELRNRCAHGARLYGSDITFYRPAKLSRKFLIKHPNVEGNNLFAYIIVLIRRLPNIEDKKNFVNRLELLIEKYKDHIHIEHIFFPENYFKILQELIK